MIKKFAPLMIAAAAMTSLAGCVAESGDVASDENVADSTAASCLNPEGTNATIAALTGAISLELHRWQITSDFTIVRGYNYQEQLALTSAGLAACGGSCPMTSNMLALQDSRMDQKVIFDGTRLSSWSFASRVVTGYRNQQTCQQNNWCPFVSHVFLWNNGQYNGYTTKEGPCDTLFVMNVNRPTAQNHAPLTASEMSGLSNALYWTTGNGPNPYISFNSNGSTVSVDPPGGGLPTGGQTSGSDLCQKYSTTNINGTPCTCAANNIYSNGQLKNNNSLTPRTYFCTQM